MPNHRNSQLKNTICHQALAKALLNPSKSYGEKKYWDFLIWLTPNFLSPEFSYSAVCCCVCYIYYCKCNDFFFSGRMWRQSSWKATWWIFYLRRDKRGKFFCFLLILYEWPSSQLSLSATAINFLQVKSSGIICYVPHQTTRLSWEPTFRDATGALRKKLKGTPCSEPVKCRVPSICFLWKI